MDGLVSMFTNETDARDALRRYFAGFGITETAELDRLATCVLAETVSDDAAVALAEADQLVGAWFAQSIGLSRDFAALAPAMAMAAFQRGRFPAGTLLSVAPLSADTLAALKAAVPVVRPASSGLPMLAQTLALPSLAALARRIAASQEAQSEQVSTAH